MTNMEGICFGWLMDMLSYHSIAATATRVEWGTILLLLYLAVPILSFIAFVITLVLYLSGRHKNKKAPGSVSSQSMKQRKILLIVSSVVLGILLLIVLGFMGLLLLAVAFM